MFKRIFSLMLVLSVLISCIAFPTQAASIYDRQKKSIYFVMDDSGSMDGTSEYDANYSLQSLVAMCDKEDTVNLYFLNSSPSSLRKINMSAKDNSVIQTIKTDYPDSNGGTPYNAVKVAQRELTDSVTQNDETEYWLVVLTDGGFDDGKNPTQDLVSFSQTTLANGTCPNVLFISIGGYIKMQSQGTLHHLEGTNIIKAMSEAAKIISGRVEVKAAYDNGNKEITFTVPYPAKNVIVFSQNSETKITSYTSKSKLDISENYNVEYPVPDANIGKSTVCFVKEENKSSIEAGEVTFVFDKPLVPANTVVLVEPAIGMVAHFYNQDGQEIDPEKLKVGETARLEYTLCDSETQDPLDVSAFGNVDYYSKINGTDYNSNNFEFVVDGNELKIEMFAKLPDGYVFSTDNTYSDLEDRRDVVLTLSNGGNFKSDYDKLKDAEGIYANILINGNPVNEKQIKDFRLKVKGKNYVVSNFSVTEDGANSRFVIAPKAGWVSPLTPKQKSYEVVLIDKDGTEYTATMNVEIPGKRDWLPVVLGILGLYILYILLSKKYFRFGATFTVWFGTLPRINNAPYFERRTIWKLYIYNIFTWDGFKNFFGRILRFIGFFIIPGKWNRQQINLYSIANGNFSCITLYATETLWKKNGGTVKVKDSNGYTSRGKYVSAYKLVRSNRRSVVDFNALINAGIIPFDDGESLRYNAGGTLWFVTYEK